MFPVIKYLLYPYVMVKFIAKEHLKTLDLVWKSTLPDLHEKSCINWDKQTLKCPDMWCWRIIYITFLNNDYMLIRLYSLFIELIISFKANSHV